MHCFLLLLLLFFSTFHALKTWLVLSRVELYRSDLKGSSYQGYIKITVNV